MAPYTINHFARLLATSGLDSVVETPKVRSSHGAVSEFVQLLSGTLAATLQRSSIQLSCLCLLPVYSLPALATAPVTQM